MVGVGGTGLGLASHGQDLPGRRAVGHRVGEARPKPRAWPQEVSWPTPALSLLIINLGWLPVELEGPLDVLCAHSSPRLL